jgi:hypothetical protein
MPLRFKILVPALDLMQIRPHTSFNASTRLCIRLRNVPGVWHVSVDSSNTIWENDVPHHEFVIDRKPGSEFELEMIEVDVRVTIDQFCEDLAMAP